MVPAADPDVNLWSVQQVDSAEPAVAVFPPLSGSRLPTSVFSRPATSLVTRFKMKKRLSDQWERVFGMYER
jgi:hypothetical protein